jgi:hypothetical protein
MLRKVVELAVETVAQSLVFHEARVVTTRYAPVRDAIARIPASDALRLILTVTARQSLVPHVEAAAARADICANAAAQAALSRLGPKVIIEFCRPDFLGRNF